MGYDTVELEILAVKAIEENNLVFFDEIHTYLPCNRATLYNHGLDKLDTIKDALDKNKLNIKAGLRKKWYESDNATVQIALYKLIGSDEESDRINSQRTKVEYPEGINIKLSDGSGT